EENVSINLKPLSSTVSNLGIFSIQRSSDEENVSINLKPFSPNSGGLPFQPQLIVGAPGDKYEREADRMADIVMSMRLPSTVEPIQRQEEETAEVISPTIQRINSHRPRRRSAIPYALLHSSEESEDEQNVNITLKSNKNRKSKRPKSRAFEADQDIERRLKAKKGSGNPLPEDTRDFMESRFGQDFGKVRVHTDGDAAWMNQELEAKAFTYGEDIYFNAGEYNPESEQGKKLLAHELTHTVQQTGSKAKDKSTLEIPDKNNKVRRQPDMISSSEAIVQRLGLREELEKKRKKEQEEEDKKRQKELEEKEEEKEEGEEEEEEKEEGEEEEEEKEDSENKDKKRIKKKSINRKEIQKSDSQSSDQSDGESDGDKSESESESEEGDSEKKEEIKEDKTEAETALADEIKDKKSEGGDFSEAEKTEKSAKEEADKTEEMVGAEDEKKAKEKGKTLEKSSEKATDSEMSKADETDGKEQQIKVKDIAGEKKAKEEADAQAEKAEVEAEKEGEKKAEEQEKETGPEDGLLEATDTPEGLDDPGVVEAPDLTGKPAPRSPDSDPAFKAAVGQTQHLAAEQSTHKPAADKAREAQDAAVDPAQQMREAQASQSEEASLKEVKPFNKEEFISNLLAVLDQNKPESQEDVEQAKGAGEATEDIKQEVENTKSESGGELEDSATREPAPDLEEPKVSTPTPDPVEETGEAPVPEAIDAEATVPKSQSEEQVEKPLEETKQALDELIPAKLQKKSIVGAPGDKYEQEADRTAETVMRMPEAETSSSLEEESESEVVPVNATVSHPQRMIQRDAEGFTAEKPTQEGEVILDQNRVELYESEAGIKVSDSVEEAKENVEETATSFREEEQGVQEETLDVQSGAVFDSQEQMFATRSEEFINVANTQAQAQQQDEGERARVTQEIQAIYDETQVNVNGILDRMDARVNAEFEATNKKARAAFEAKQQELFQEWKHDYYYNRNPLWIPWIEIKTGWAYVKVRFYLKRFFNLPLWAYNKIISGLPSEVNNIYGTAREVFVAEQKAGVYRIADIVEEELANAKNAVQEGRDRVTTYVAALPESLKGVGNEAAANVQAQFDSLESSINDRQNKLVDDLTAKYEASLKEIDKRIKELKDQNKSLLAQAVAAIAKLAAWILRQVLRVIEPVIAQIPGVGSRAGDFLDAFVDDPSGIMDALFGGVGEGFKNFGKNIATHLKNALFDWLLGMDMPIKFPDKFDLQGILDIILQVLGLTKDYIFELASGALPDWASDILTTLIEDGPAALKEYLESIPEDLPALAVSFFTAIVEFPKKGIMVLWDFIKSGLSTLKDVFMSGIMFEVVIPEIVIAGIQWVLSLTNPASGIVKIAKAIVDLLIFFINNMDMIRELLEAIGSVMDAIISKIVSQIAKAVEFALVKILPLVLGLLASVLGLGGLPGKIQKVIEKLRSPVDKVVGGVFDSVGSVLMVLDPAAFLMDSLEDSQDKKSKKKGKNKKNKKKGKKKSQKKKGKTKSKKKGKTDKKK
ncbi:MAG: eCIS core domain-containing protein, partial [Limnospira sp.]